MSGIGDLSDTIDDSENVTDPIIDDVEIELDDDDIIQDVDDIDQVEEEDEEDDKDEETETNIDKKPDPVKISQVEMSKLTNRILKSCISGRTSDCDPDMFKQKDKVELKGDDRITRPYLSKYEYVRILATRTKQLELEAKRMVSLDKDDNRSDREVAELEIKKGVVPFKVIRSHPNNTFEIWTVDELVNCGV
jgi:DNA-directed RNA polymerase subunit K/omega